MGGNRNRQFAGQRPVDLDGHQLAGAGSQQGKRERAEPRTHLEHHVLRLHGG